MDEAGRRVSAGARAWALHRPSPAEAELHPAEAWSAVAGAVGDALEGVDAASLRAIGVTAQRTATVFLAGSDEVAIWTNADGRASAEGLAIERAHGQQIYRVAGRLPALLYLPARMAWMRAHRAQDAARIDRVLSLSDWVVWRLCGAAVTEPTQAAETGLFDLAAGRWSEALLVALGVPASVLSPIGAPGVGVGSTRPGGPFPEGIEVVPAGGDTQCAALATRAIEPGATYVVAGTTMLAGRVEGSAARDPDGRMWTSPHALGDRWVLEAHCGEAGAALEWLSRVCGTDPATLAAEAATSEPGAGGAGFLGTVPSDASDFPLVREAGFWFPAPLLALGRSRADLARALLEGVAFAARAGVGWLDAVGSADVPPTVSGGLARSAVFTAALAGALGREVFAADGSSSALGAAIAAAAVHHGGVAAAARAMAATMHTVAPPLDADYPSRYAAWRARAEELDARAVRVKDLMG